MNSFDRFLSYLHPIYVEVTKSEINPRIELCIRKGRYILNSSNANYSYHGLYELFKKFFRKVPMDWDRVDNVLVLGFGAGCVVPLIRGYNAECSIVGVEIDSKVIELARNYFGIDEFRNTQVVHGDAVDYLARCRKAFDIIIVDIFIDRDVPSAVESPEFIASLHNCLTPQGKVIFNKMAYNKKTKAEVEKVYSIYKEIFPMVTLYKFMITGRILVASAN